ncbi:hypothetical protein L596_025318 [Steinernema carpocapsae]|uniref:Secreted protein n=1 Tax=Steinernema carpocapsae TaxID=34508 RepID=A0A4U5M7F9_STECR|nr:hypothetical protein L596_025318 [Steinernema carpocapsae]
MIYKCVLMFLAILMAAEQLTYWVCLCYDDLPNHIFLKRLRHLLAQSATDLPEPMHFVVTQTFAVKFEFKDVSKLPRFLYVFRGQCQASTKKSKRVQDLDHLCLKAIRKCFEGHKAGWENHHSIRMTKLRMNGENGISLSVVP